MKTHVFVLNLLDELNVLVTLSAYTVDKDLQMMRISTWLDGSMERFESRVER